MLYPNAPTHSLPARSIRRALRGASLTALLLAGGCAVANNAIRSDFPDYNSIIQFNQTQQMVLNLVRMHYRESPLFLQAGSVTAAYESRTEVNSETTLTNATTPFTIGGSYQFTSRPTINYTPIEGKAYVQQFMTEISYDNFALLVRAGWPVNKLATMLVERFTTETGEVLVNNGKSHTREQFKEMVKRLEKAEESDRVSVTIRPKGGYDLHVGEITIPFERMQLRSLVDVMFAASQDVETPPEHERRTKKFDPGGNLRIAFSKDKPKDALVWCEYDGYYYSVDHGDLAAKDSLALLVQISRIQSAPAGPAPLLTIPVNN